MKYIEGFNEGSRLLKGYWTFDRLKEEALKYRSRSEFQLSSRTAYSTAYKKGWLNDICSHMNMLRRSWTFDEVKEEAPLTARNRSIKI